MVPHDSEASRLPPAPAVVYQPSEHTPPLTVATLATVVTRTEVAMDTRILTEVTAQVDARHEQELLEGFHRLLQGPMPDGLVRTELLRGADGAWRIQTLWASREALDAMRALAEPPAAPALFRSLGAEPHLTILEVAAGHRNPQV